MMVRQGSRHRLPTKEWCFRLVLAAAAGWAGYLSAKQSWAIALPDSQVEQAYSLAPNNSHIGARLSEKLSGPEATSADRTRAARLARAALRNDPTAVEAVGTLGLDALVRGDNASAKHFFAYSEILSRRDLRTQLWAIEDAVKREDVAGALKHYDIALRTKKSAPKLLYPVLAGAIADAEIRAELIKTLGAKPIWANRFVQYVAMNGPDPVASAELFKGLRHISFPLPLSVNGTIINRLIKEERFDAAWSYYSGFRGNGDRRTSRDPNFKALLKEPTAFDWVPGNGPGLSAAIQPSADGGIFDFAVASSVSGTLLQQMQMLPAGTYVLEGVSNGVEQPPTSRPYWMLSCRRGREIGRIDLPNSNETGGHFTGQFTVPENCPVQILALVARSSSEIAGVMGQIYRASLRPYR